MAKAKVQEPEFQDIDTAPKDGSVIEVTENGEDFLPAFWRRTRRMDKKIFRWVERGDWVEHHALIANKPLPFEPLGWRPRFPGK